MRSEEAAAGLNSPQVTHLVSSAQYADKLLTDVESILFASESKSPFRKYKTRLSPAQVKTVEDYVARIRTQIVRVLEGNGIPLPEPKFESVHSIRVNLAFVRIAFQECTADRMRGYGPVPEQKVRELNGLVDEMVSAVDKLDSYLAQGLGQDLQGRLQRLHQAGYDISTVKNLERIINDYGFVEFRSTLSMIIDRLESKSYEIAMFGQVSSGKSSLLNYIVQNAILPVGVIPITAVPTRLIYGNAPRVTLWYADKGAQQIEIGRLAEFVTEQQNPANYKHVTRIVVELPSSRLRDGVVLVDTPGLGSLATAGATETLAYLPRCDLGVVLVGAGTTLTQDDLSTIQALYEAGVPAVVLLSKSDLLAAEDRTRALAYIQEQIHSRLGITLSVHPVSVEATHAALVEDWLNQSLLPLYENHQRLAQESLGRKIGSLREAVETALRLRIERVESPEGVGGGDANEIGGFLRRAVGRFAETREACMDITGRLRMGARESLAIAASTLVECWQRGDQASASVIVEDTLTQAAAEEASFVLAELEDLAHELVKALQAAAQALHFKDVPSEEELTSVLKEMPRLDPGTFVVDVRPGFLLKISKKLAIWRVEQRLLEQVGSAVSESFSTYGSMLDSWIRRVLNELQLRFDEYADTYRAHLDRLAKGRGISGTEEVRIRSDLALLATAGSATELTTAS
jgi:GTP-binding protein EngB required for normal cell division